LIYKKRVLVSASGGRTSAMMAYLIKKAYSHIYDLIFVFANTGREKEETLMFLDKVDKHFGLGIVWVEAVVHFGTRKACTHKLVSFELADRGVRVRAGD